MFQDITSQITVVERSILLKITCLCGFTPLEIPKNPFVKCPQCGRNYYHQTTSSILMEEPITVPPITENWLSPFKDGCNSNTTNPVLGFPLIEKWKIPIPVGISNIPKLLYHEGKILVCYSHNERTMPYSQAITYDAETGALLKKFRRYGDGRCRGYFVVDKNSHLWLGAGHNGNAVYDINTGALVKNLDWYSGIKEGWSQIDENGTYGYASGGVDSINIQVIANDLDSLQKRWGKSNSMKITGLTSNGMGQPAAKDGILYVPDGVLWAYSTVGGSVVWQKGRWPKQEAIGKVCHYGNVVLKDDRLFVLGRECLTLHQGTWGEPGFVYPTYSVPRLYEYDLSGNYKSHIDLALTPNLFLYQDRFIPFFYIITESKIIISSLNDVTIYDRYTHVPLHSVQFTPLWVVPRDCYGIVLAGNILFMENGKEIRALNLDTLQEVWQWSYTSFLSTYVSSMLPADGKLFVVTTNNELFCLGE